MTWWSIVKQELKQIFLLDPKRVMYLFGASLAYALLFGALYSNHVVKTIPMAVYDEDQSQMSRALVQAFEDSERYQVIAYTSSQEEMESYLREKEAYVAIAIPAHFSRDVKTGHAPSLLVNANGANVAIANTVISTAQEIMMGFTKETGSALVEGIGQLPDPAMNKTAPIDFRLRVLNNPTLSYLEFFVLGLAMAAFQQGIVLSVGASLLQNRAMQLGSASSFTILASRLLPYWGLGLVAYLLTLAVTIGTFDMPMRGHVLDLLLLGAAFAYAVAAMASVAAFLCKNEVDFTRFSLFYSITAFVLSGYTWPLHAMGNGVLVFSYLTPLTYFADTVRNLTLVGYDAALFQHIAALLLMGSLCFAGAVLLYSRQANKEKATFSPLV